MFVEFQGCFSGFSGVTKSAEIEGVLVRYALLLKNTNS